MTEAKHTQFDLGDMNAADLMDFGQAVHLLFGEDFLIFTLCEALDRRGLRVWQATLRPGQHVVYQPEYLADLAYGTIAPGTVDAGRVREIWDNGQYDEVLPIMRNCTSYEAENPRGMETIIPLSDIVLPLDAVEFEAVKQAGFPARWNDLINVLRTVRRAA